MAIPAYEVVYCVEQRLPGSDWQRVSDFYGDKAIVHVLAAKKQALIIGAVKVASYKLQRREEPSKPEIAA
jgi:hypothetical protein